MDEGKLEIYRYVRDQHDKYISARESIITRFGNIRVLAGLLLTVISLSFTLVLKSVEQSSILITRAVTVLPLIFFLVAVYYIIRALLAVPNMVGMINIRLPGVEQGLIREAFEPKTLDADWVLRSLTENYLVAVDYNMKSIGLAEADLDKSSRLIRRGLFATVAFLLLTLLSNISVTWIVPLFLSQG
jgi:hypothetical protein